jgi:hypothetical protein
MRRLNSALTNNKYSRNNEIKTGFLRQIERIEHDPNRYYDGRSSADYMPAIKAVKLG